MDATKSKTPVSYSLTKPALPLTLIVAYFQCREKYNFDTIEVESVTFPVLALRVGDAADATQRNTIDAIVLANGQLVEHWSAKSETHEETGYVKDSHRICLTSEVDQQRKVAEGYTKARMIQISRNADARARQTQTLRYADERAEIAGQWKAQG